MAVIELTGAELAGPGPGSTGAGAIGPRRRRLRGAVARIGGGVVGLIPILVLSSFITYRLGALANSEPAATTLGQDAATPAAVAHLTHVLGLDKPLVVQYWDWLSQAVRGNLGTSYFSQIPVSQSISQRLPVDLSIAITDAMLGRIHRVTAEAGAAGRRG